MCIIIIKSGFTYWKQALKTADIISFYDEITFEYARNKAHNNHGFIRDMFEITRKF